MITKKDREIIRFIEVMGFATIYHIGRAFYNYSDYKYDLARKQLKKISREGDYIKSFRNTETNQLIYIPTYSNIKKVSKHDILMIDYVAHLRELGVDLETVEIERDFGGSTPDLFVKFKFNGSRYCQLVEVQLRHDFVDVNRFKDKMPLILEETNNYAPDLVIIQDTRKDYEKINETCMKIIRLDTNLSDLPKVLI